MKAEYRQEDYHVGGPEAGLSDTWTSNEKKFYEDTDFGIVLGSRFAISTGKGEVSVDIRLTQGMIDVAKESEFVLKNRVLSFFIGYSL
jgi:hypothetical protein